MHDFSSILTQTPPPSELETLKDLVKEYIEAQEKYTSTLRYNDKLNAEAVFKRLKREVFGTNGSLF
jgi:uncharacterized protein YaaR (DUF327 family)